MELQRVGNNLVTKQINGMYNLQKLGRGVKKKKRKKMTAALARMLVRAAASCAHLCGSSMRQDPIPSPQKWASF